MHQGGSAKLAYRHGLGATPDQPIRKNDQPFTATAVQVQRDTAWSTADLTQHRLERYMTAITSVLIALALLVIGPFPVTTATGYPDRPILILVPYPPGGATDIVTRVVATEMQSLIGTPITVENRPGRDGLLALQALGKATPDGYTLMAGNPTTNAVNPVLHPGQLGFDYDKGVVPISVMSEIPNAMLVT